METPYNVVDLFFDAAQHHPERKAIITEESALTFGELAEQVLETAAYFQSKGLRKGDRVLVFVPMSLDLYRIVLALFRMGATAVFLDEWVSRERLQICCRIANCKAWIGGWKVQLLSLVTPELRRMPVRLSLKQMVSSGYESTATTSSDTALITFTTGSTGTPKAAKRTHGFLKAQFEALTDTIQPKETDVDMPVLPIVLLLNLGIGCTSVIAPFKAAKPEKMEPERILQLFEKSGCNRMVASPYFVKRLSEFLLKQQRKTTFTGKIFTGGAPVFPSEAKLYTQAFPYAHIEIVYGSTESEPISSIPAEELLLKQPESILKDGGLAVGKPYHGTQVRILRITDEPISCDSAEEWDNWQVKPGTIGEIVVAGNHVLREYVNNEEALKRNKVFIGTDCWHRTGDSGFLNEDHQLFLCGRCSALIPYQDRLLSTFTVENEFQQIPSISMATLLKAEDKLIIAAELKEGVSDQSIVESKLKAIVPEAEKVCFLKRLPRDPRHHSKIDYEILRKQLTKGL